MYPLIKLARLDIAGYIQGTRGVCLTLSDLKALTLRRCFTFPGWRGEGGNSTHSRGQKSCLRVLEERLPVWSKMVSCCFRHVIFLLNIYTVLIRDTYINGKAEHRAHV